MIPELAHFNTFKALGSFLEARDIVLSLLQAKPSFYTLYKTKYDQCDNCLIESLKDCFYEDNRDGRETTAYYGVVEVNDVISQAIEFLNEAKKDFKATLMSLSLLDPNSQAELMKIVKDPGSWPSRLDRYPANMGRLNINHVYRCYVISQDRPVKIQQSWSKSSKSIKKITKKEAISRILALESPLPEHLQIQYESLASLPDSASLAVVHNETPHIKTNIFFKNRNVPVTVKTRLPIIVPRGANRIFIDFMDRSEQDSSRNIKKRKDVLIHESPVASSIHVYRYRDFHDQR